MYLHLESLRYRLKWMVICLQHALLLRLACSRVCKSGSRDGCGRLVIAGHMGWKGLSSAKRLARLPSPVNKPTGRSVAERAPRRKVDLILPHHRGGKCMKLKRHTSEQSWNLSRGLTLQGSPTLSPGVRSLAQKSEVGETMRTLKTCEIWLC